jgi:hypothetical protein
MDSRRVRGEHGLLPWVDHGFTIQNIKVWRAAQNAAELPSGLADFYATHGLCFDCQGHGVQMIGWSKPENEVDVEAARELSLEELPLYGVCKSCGGSGLRIG